MGLLFEKDKFKFRTKEQMLEDVYVAFTKTDLSNGAKVSILNDVLWQYTHYYGKYVGCPLWSQKAIVAYNNLNANKNFDEIFIHEHVVPKDIIRKRLISLYSESKLSKEIIKTIIEKCLIGVVILKEEDKVLDRTNLRKKMPPYLEGKPLEDYSEEDVWSRYTCLNKFLNFKINVCKVKEENNKLIITKIWI